MHGIDVGRMENKTSLARVSLRERARTNPWWRGTAQLEEPDHAPIDVFRLQDDPTYRARRCAEKSEI
ncbi:MAG: hypothetical protein EBX78_09225 [Gammaproteobacteria bacterium]|nr:hypothetical protein [Gammaproteobacteria bacterium]